MKHRNFFLVCLLGIINAENSFQIRSKISLQADLANVDQESESITKELQALFCEEELKIEDATSCNISSINLDVSGEAQFFLDLTIPKSKKELKKYYEEEIESIINPPPGGGSGDGSGEGSGESLNEEALDWLFSDLVVNVDLFSKEDKDALNQRKSENNYDYIDPSSLDLNSFVFCDDQCKEEGFWMMIGELYMHMLI